MADKLSNNRLVIEYEFDSPELCQEADAYAAQMGKGFFGTPINSFAGRIISTDTSSSWMRRWSQRETRQTWDRQTVLEEKWLPHEGQPEMLFYPVQTGNSIGQLNTLIHTTQGLKRYQDHHGYSFAPTRELAEEIVQIRSGIWLPKKGDIFFCEEEPSGMTAYFNFENIPKDPFFAYYPSAEQRDKYAPKQPTLTQEPRSEPITGIMMDGDKIMIQTNTNNFTAIPIEELARLLRNVDYSRAEAIPGAYSDNSRKEGRG